MTAASRLPQWIVGEANARLETMINGETEGGEHCGAAEASSSVSDASLAELTSVYSVGAALWVSLFFADQELFAYVVGIKTAREQLVSLPLTA